MNWKNKIIRNNSKTIYQEVEEEEEEEEDYMNL